MDTYLPLKRTTRALSWYLHRRCRTFWKRSFTPVSAKIRAISSILPAAALVTAATAVAVVFCRTLGSNPWLTSDTPERLA